MENRWIGSLWIILDSFSNVTIHNHFVHSTCQILLNEQILYLIVIGIETGFLINTEYVRKRDRFRNANIFRETDLRDSDRIFTFVQNIYMTTQLKKF